MNNINSSIEKKIAREVIDYLLEYPKTSLKKITTLKGQIGKKYKYDRVIKNATILNYASEEEKLIITKLLKRRSVRTLSGVSVIAIMTKPLPCPGNCVYCPGNASQPGKKAAKSYTGREPAAMRSIYCSYDPYEQVQSRIRDLQAIGHKVDMIHV